MHTLANDGSTVDAFRRQLITKRYVCWNYRRAGESAVKLSGFYFQENLFQVYCISNLIHHLQTESLAKNEIRIM
jgi:hypothetical protein